MKCPNCESEVAADARFCGECGQAMKQLGKSLAQPEPQQEVDLSGLRTTDDMDTKPLGSSSESRVMQPGEVFAGRYQVTQLIGEGGMGVVYRAHDKLVDKDVALKLIRADRLAGKDAVKRLIREGVTSRDIRHPNVVAVYDVGESDGQPYMSMEFIAGRSLRSWNRARLQSGTDCSMKTAANIISEILSGLEAAHKAGVVHRDLKPENVMLLGEPSDQAVSLKILDFGVARAAGTGDTGATSLGTRGYMAPEQITAPDAAQPSADLYSLSVMFYELLVGVVPQGHWQPPSAGRSDVPPAIDKLIERGLSNNPRVRPQVVAEYGKALAEAMRVGHAGSTTGAQWLEKLEKTDLKPLISNIKGNLDKLKIPTGSPGNNQQPASNASASAPSPTGDKNYWQWFMYSLTKRFIDGKGRANRKEYWSFQLFAVLLLFVALVIDESLFESMMGVPAEAMMDAIAAGVYSPPATSICLIGLLAPALALASRRGHDQNMSGVVAVLVCLTFVGNIWLGLNRGTVGDNQYGPDPFPGAAG